MFKRKSLQLGLPTLRISRQIIFVVFFLMLGVSNLASQVKQDSIDSQEKRWKLLKYDMKHVFKGIGYSYSRPFHWQGNDWSKLGYTALGTGMLYLIDDQTSEFIQRQQEGVPKGIRDYGSTIGSPTYNYMFTGGVYLTGLLAKSEKIRRTGVLMIASASAAGLLQQITKSVVGRARPMSGKGKDTFDPFNSNRDFHSFPSGHAILAFTNTYAIGKQFKNLWVRAGIYTVGAVPGVSRIWEGQHWLSDVVLGIAISIFTVESIDRYLNNKYKSDVYKQDKLVNWNLNLGLGQVGITGNF
jgi:hypothetical protein